MRNLKHAGAALAAALAAVAAFSANGPSAKSIFAKNNLVAWCIVPFDAVHRGPVERAQMLKRLGITMLAYDWRDRDIPDFDREVAALAKYRIKLQAFWLASGPDPASDKGVRAVLDLLKRRRVRTEIWYMFQPPAGFDQLSQENKVAEAAKAVKYLAVEAQKLRCRVGIYNHEGWYGEPENGLARTPPPPTPPPAPAPAPSPLRLRFEDNGQSRDVAFEPDRSVLVGQNGASSRLLFGR